MHAMTAKKKGIRWSFVGKGALIVPPYTCLLCCQRALRKGTSGSIRTGRQHDEPSNPSGALAQTGEPATRNCNSSNLRHFSAGFVGSLLYIHAFKF